jgi:hypothetical protein
VISDDDIQRAVDWLRDNAPVAARCRATREYLSEYTKALRATLMRGHASLPVAAQEREALADERYLDHLSALRIAVEDDEKMRWLKAAAEAKIEAWRTQAANQRINV